MRPAEPHKMNRMKNEKFIEAKINGKYIGAHCFDVEKHEDDIPIEYVTAQPMETHQTSPTIRRRNVIVQKSEFEDEITTHIKIEETTKIELDGDVTSTHGTKCEIARAALNGASRKRTAKQQANVCDKCSSKYLPRIVLYKPQLPIETPRRFESSDRQEHNDSKSCKTANKNFECYQCDYKTIKLYRLKAHMVRHSAIKAFECEICSKQFSRSGYLTQHRHIHIDKRQNIKRYHCYTCGYATHHNSNLYRHMQIHSGAKSLASTS